MNSAAFSATAPNLFRQMSSEGTVMVDEEELVREVNRARTSQRMNSMPTMNQGAAARARAMVFGNPFQGGDLLDAEDMRFHAIRRAVMDRSSKKKLARYRRVQSERGTVSQAMKNAVEEVMKEDERLLESSEQLAKIIADFEQEPDDSVALPYLAWACSQLGVQQSYPQFESRAKAQRCMSHEEELSLSQMIEDSSPIMGSKKPAPAEHLPTSMSDMTLTEDGRALGHA